MFTAVTALSAPGSQLAAEVYPNAEVSFGETRMGKWREGAKDMNDTIGVSMDVASFIKDDDATDTAVWLSRRGWAVESLDSREEMDTTRQADSGRCHGHRSGEFVRDRATRPNGERMTCDGNRQ